MALGLRIPTDTSSKKTQVLDYFAKVGKQQRKKINAGCKELCEVLFKDLCLFVSLYLPTHNWCTIGPLIILVPEDSKCSNEHPRLFHFSIQ